MHGDDGVEDRGRASGAWGIDDYDVGANAGPVKPGHDVGGVTDEKFSIFHVVVAGVLLGVADGWSHDLYADGSTRPLCQK